MYSFPELIKAIREEASFTQGQFAEAVGVSAILVAMIESGQKNVSKNFVVKLAKLMDVHPASISPFLLIRKNEPVEAISGIERMFIKFGERMQTHLIKDRAQFLKKYAEKK
jgi:transcriptional regulator with XRE-family HTH domain